MKGITRWNSVLEILLALIAYAVFKFSISLSIFISSWGAEECINVEVKTDLIGLFTYQFVKEWTSFLTVI